MFMRTVQQNVFLILNSVPVISVTEPELIRPYIPVMTHFLDQKVVARKTGGRSVFIWEAGWEEPFGNNSTFSCFRNLEILHGYPFIAAYIFGDNA